jgi:hypothetical protein
MQFSFGKATIKLLSLFACDKCGKQQTGDTVTLEIARFECLAELVAPISKAENRARDMPIGWASYGGDKRNGYRTRFYCGACSAKHEAESAEKREAENAARIAAGLAPNHY